MSKALTIVIVVALVVSGAWFFYPGKEVAHDDGPQWTTYNEGLMLAKEQNRSIMVNFYTDWCSYCERMNTETFGNAEVAAYLNEHFVPVNVDSTNDKTLSNEYMVRGYPTIWFLEPDGEKIAAIPGFLPPEQFMPVLKYIKVAAYKDMNFKEFMEKEMEKAE